MEKIVLFFIILLELICAYYISIYLAQIEIYGYAYSTQIYFIVLFVVINPILVVANTIMLERFIKQKRVGIGFNYTLIYLTILSIYYLNYNSQQSLDYNSYFIAATSLGLVSGILDLLFYLIFNFINKRISINSFLLLIPSIIIFNQEELSTYWSIPFFLFCYFNFVFIGTNKNDDDGKNKGFV